MAPFLLTLFNYIEKVQFGETCQQPPVAVDFRLSTALFQRHSPVLPP
jgi:hypothetical protein